jgi:UDP-N-acetylmuramoylalanine--D-glutamate ligase
VLGKHDLNDVKNAEFIVPNQRVRQSSPEMKLARKLGIPTQTEIALFLNHCPATVIGVTGTRGKSTTASLIAHLLRDGRKGKQNKIWLGGNILVSPLTFLSRIKKQDIVVLELSSFQTESMAPAQPVDIAVITNLMRDHLNAYASMGEYAEAKAQMFRQQHPHQTVILNADDAYGRAWAKEAPSHVILFSKRDRLPIAASAFPLLGAHNRLNANAAIAAARAAGASVDQVTRGLKTFKPLPHRLQTVRVWRNIRFVNDTTATTPDGTIAAIQALADNHHHLWLIAGGADKHLAYAEFARVVKKHHPRIHILLLPGDASRKIKKALASLKEHIHPVLNILQAVDFARRAAIPGDAVVLSPGAASFNQFKNEFERGEVFMKAVREL